MNRTRLSDSEFFRLARRAFDDVLKPHGFSCAESRRATFYRKASDFVWHLVTPVRSVRLPKYDVWVFPHSPAIEPSFVLKFPDHLSPATDVWCHLHPTEGIGLSQEWYSGRTEEGFVRNFDRFVAPALIEHAIPYLENIRELDQLLPLIRSRYYREQADQI